jgi:hypothetical protein
MKMAKDIQSLSSIVGDDFGDYREIVRDELASKCQARWPLLAQGLSAEPATTAVRRGRRRQRPWTSVDLPADVPAAAQLSRATPAASMPIRSPAPDKASVPVLSAVVKAAARPARPASLQQPATSSSELNQLFKRIESSQRGEAGQAADFKLKLFKKAA